MPGIVPTSHRKYQVLLRQSGPSAIFSVSRRDQPTYMENDSDAYFRCWPQLLHNWCTYYIYYYYKISFSWFHLYMTCKPALKTVTSVHGDKIFTSGIQLFLEHFVWSYTVDSRTRQLSTETLSQQLSSTAGWPLGVFPLVRHIQENHTNALNN